MHGWYPEAWPLEQPDFLFGVTMAHLRDEYFWVTTERQAAYLTGLGYGHVRAIGLPIVYVLPPAVRREPGSLLVMPAHSMPSMDRAKDTATYVAAISGLKSEFDRICVCVGGHDWVRGNWVREFRDAGFDVIRGAGDASSLVRMVDLFTQYESVTSNGFGSLLAYASAFGAKASIYGPFPDLTHDMLKNEPFYIDHPELIESETRGHTEAHCREILPEFFCHPAEAEERVEWARAEIGWQHRLGPEDLRHAFGWTAVGRAKSRAGSLGRIAGALLSEPAKERLREIATSEGRRGRSERRRLETVDAGTPGTTQLFGGAFEFLDAGAYLRVHRDCFTQHVYEFRPTSESPLIVVSPAGTGLLLVYFKCLFPKARILALEPHDAAFRMLERNCRSFGLEGVRLLRGTLSKDTVADILDDLASPAENPDTGTPTRSDEAGLAVDPSAPGAIDMLCLSTEDGQCGSLAEAAPLLATAESVVVDCSASSNEPLGLNVVIEGLEAAGFRVAVLSSHAALSRPLVRIPSGQAGENRVHVLGYRA